MTKRTLKKLTNSALALYILLSFAVVKAQKLNPEIEFSFNSGQYSKDGSYKTSPLWARANLWGKAQNDAAWAKISDTLINNGTFLLDAGLGALYTSQKTGSVLHEIYLSGKLYFIDFNIGRKAFSPLADNDNLTTGHFLMGSNAQPIPRFTLGIFNYTNVPFTNGWMQVKGALSQGYLNDNNKYIKGHNKDLLHEKFVFIRLSKWAVKPYIGLIHSALYGGENIPTDFWATFFAKGSSKIGGGEQTNAAGAHMGLFDFGWQLEKNNWSIQGYFQKPFADGSGMRLNRGFNKDHIIGLVVKNDHSKKIISALAIEHIKTTYQSGAGIPDPYDPLLPNPDNPNEIGVYFFPGSMDNPTQFMAKYYPDVPSQNWDKYDIVAFLKAKVNFNNRFGGRDDYMNNGMYYAGWTYRGQSMGTPLFHTEQQINSYKPQWILNPNGVVFINNRIKGWHIGMGGTINNLEYNLKATYTRNYGSYAQTYMHRYSWIPSAQNYFENGLTQSYCGLSLQHPLFKFKNTKINLFTGYDFGQLYHAFGVGAGIHFAIK